ncbi:sarcosine oxidase subunit gamma [Nocardiopsis gilva]
MMDETTTAEVPAPRAEPRSPVAHLADRIGGAGSADTALLRELPFLAQVELRVDADEEQAASRLAGEFLGCPLPEAGRVSGGGHPYVLWCGPGWYLVVDGGATGRGLAAGLCAALGGEYGAVCGSVVDVSGQRTVLELRGPRARDVLAQGCPLDLHPRVFAAGAYAQTLFATTNIGIHHTGMHSNGNGVREKEGSENGVPVFRILVRASFADHLTRRLLDAMETETRGSATTS